LSVSLCVFVRRFNAGYQNHLALTPAWAVLTEHELAESVAGAMRLPP
jgi:hypothetical protein